MARPSPRDVAPGHRPGVLHSRRVPSDPALASSPPSRLNATSVTVPWWPLSGSPTPLPPPRSQSRTDPSAPLLARSRPWGSTPRCVTAPVRPAPVQVGQRWVVERTNAWLNDYGPLRRCTERRRCCVEAYLALAAAIVTLRALLRAAWYRYRWNTHPRSPRIR